MRRRIILSIDGGGIRGLIPIAILKRLNDLTKYKLQESVDLYAGTSTGALIGSALMLKTELGYVYNITDILNLYSFRSASIFEVGGSKGVNPLKLIMERTFQNLTVGDQKHDFLFMAEDNSNNSLHTISNLDDTYDHIKLSELLLACSAIKGFFEPVSIVGKTLSDGVTVMKNPSLEAYKHYQAIYPNDEMVILSLGTGDVSVHYDDEVEKKVEETHQILSEMNASNPLLNYYRIQPKLNFAKPEMNNTSQENIQNLLIDAQNYINHNMDVLDKIACEIRNITMNSRKTA
ncbi:MAG: patatin-like phospholipase family protein [Crocinitomicaceae bacterium]|nr:patatin-like phospholipase family protein [Crocinitomicaceae bacterium]